MTQRALDLYAIEAALCSAEFDAENEFLRKGAQIARTIVHARIDQILVRQKVQTRIERSELA